MPNIQADSPPSKTGNEKTTDELLRDLHLFPMPVLPIGLLRELQSRGDAIHDSVAAHIRDTVKSLENGLNAESESAFFAFALLIPIATEDDQSLIESILTLPDKSLTHLIGDLVLGGMSHLIARFFQNQDESKVIAWIDRLADHEKLESINACPLFRGITLAVCSGRLDRTIAIDVFVNRLQKRASMQDDFQSALLVCELLELSASDVEEVDAVVRSSFDRGQIELDYVDLSSWDGSHFHSDLNRDEQAWTDPATELSRWCFGFVSDDLDPIDANFRKNESGQRLFGLAESSVPSLINQLRHSNHERFPRDAVESLDRAFPDAYSVIIDLVREEVARYQSDPEAWSGTGAYLGLVLTLSSGMPLPTDLLQTILQMPQDDREKVFGDQFELLVASLGLTPLPQIDFVEQWIWNADRSYPGRREMVNFYFHACSQQFGASALIEKLSTGLRRALLEESMLIAPYAENLAYVATQEHQQVLEEAFRRDDVEWFLPLKHMQCMVQDPDFAEQQRRERIRHFRSVDQMISNGAMFQRDVSGDKPQSVRPQKLVYQPPSPTQPPAISTTTIRSDVRTPRNAPCPCGSGKKYKKCCHRK